MRKVNNNLSIPLNLRNAPHKAELTRIVRISKLWVFNWFIFMANTNPDHYRLIEQQAFTEPDIFEYVDYLQAAAAVLTATAGVLGLCASALSPTHGIDPTFLQPVVKAGIVVSLALAILAKARANL